MVVAQAMNYTLVHSLSHNPAHLQQVNGVVVQHVETPLTFSK